MKIRRASPTFPSKGMGKKGDSFIIILDIAKAFSLEELAGVVEARGSQPGEARAANE